LKIIIELDDDAVSLLQREINGQGGWQSLLKQMQDNLKGNQLTLMVGDISKIVSYTTNYGQGGFEDRLRPIISEVRNLVNEILNAMRM